MAWNLSTGAQKALLAKNPTNSANKIGNTISFGDGDGTGATDTINDSGNGLSVFGVDDWILIIGGAFNNTLIKALTVAAGKIEVKAGAFTTTSSGTNICLVKLSTGSFAQVFANGVIDGYTGVRPAAGADTVESGTKLVTYSRAGGAFVAGSSAYGLNVGEFTGATLQRALDPVTGLPEQWRGLGIADGTLGYVRWYANDKTTGSSTSAIRMDGVAATSGGDINISGGLAIATGVASEITGANLTMTGV